MRRRMSGSFSYSMFWFVFLDDLMGQVIEQICVKYPKIDTIIVYWLFESDDFL